MYAMHVMYAERGASSMDTFSITAQTFVIVGQIPTKLLLRKVVTINSSDSNMLWLKTNKNLNELNVIGLILAIFYGCDYVTYSYS